MYTCCFLIFLIQLIALVESVEIECRYDSMDYYILGVAYTCYVQNNPNITSPNNAEITSAIGTHHNVNIEDNSVKGIWIKQKIVFYFPRGLEQVFKNLKIIAIEKSGLKQIHELDLKPFPKLELISLDSNDIEILKKGLFDFNPQLRFIVLNGNKISQIHPEIFDHLIGLVALYLKNNICIDRYEVNYFNDTTAARDLIQEVKSKCPQSDDTKIKLDINSSVAASFKNFSIVYFSIFVSWFNFAVF